MCALFSKSEKVKMAPQTTESKIGSQKIQSLLGQTPNLPTQDIAGLSSMEQLIQKYLPQYFANINAGGDLAQGEYTKILTDQYNPADSPYYEGLRGEAARLKAKGITSLRQRANLGGMLDSTNAIGQEGDFANQSDSSLLHVLGQLFENERGRKLNAAQGIQTSQSQNLSNVAAVGQMAGAEREIEQARNNALYQQAIETILFPYKYQASLANALLNYSPGMIATGGGANDLGMLLGGISSGVGAYVGAGGRFGMGAAGAAGAAGGAGAAGAGAAACDINVKENIEHIETALDKIHKLDGKTYNYKGVSDRRHAGVIAQDVEEILPEAVEMINGIRYVRFDGMIALLVNAIKELNAKLQVN